jgi:hypothetical protein
MLAEKQSCAMVVDDNNILIGLLTLADIDDFSKIMKSENRITKVWDPSLNKFSSPHNFQLFVLLC